MNTILRDLRADCSKLLLDLLTGAPGREIYLLSTEDPEHRTLDGARLLLDRSAAAQPDHPLRSAWLAASALQILQHLAVPSGSLDSLVLRASCLAANAFLLQRDLDSAEALLSLANHLAPSAEDSAKYLLRILALLRFEQTREHEAIGLLLRAKDLFRTTSSISEVTSTAQLLVLLYADAGETDSAIEIYSQAIPSDPNLRPWLASRAAFTAAFCLATYPNRRDAARAAITHGSSYAPYIRDETESQRLCWLEARALARIGNQEAHSTLCSLRSVAVHRRSFLEAFLLTLDLIAFQATAGQDIGDLLLDLERLSGPITVVDSATCTTWMGLLAGTSSPWGSTTSIAHKVLRTYRCHRINNTVEPIPFA